MAPTNAHTMLATSLLVTLLISGAAMASHCNVTAGVAMLCPSACPECPPTIAPGYQYFEGLGYYKMHRQWMTWFDAKATCEREGADLAVINSQEEAEVIGNIYLRHATQTILLYVGFFMYDTYHVTVLDEALRSTGYEQWGPDEPSSAGACGAFFYTQGLYMSNCSVPRQFICEI